MAQLGLTELHRRYDQRVTFCVHIKNRMHQLRETLPENLAVVRRFPQAGLVLMNYNSDDGLHEWVAARFRDDIAAGRLLYGRERQATTFHASKSKNLAHRLGPGELLVNLDCDNFIGGNVPFLLELADRRGGVLAHMWTGTQRDGTYGRIAISRAAFFRIGGYDETLLPMGFQDQDLIKRARLARIPVLRVPGGTLDVRAIANSKDESVRHTGSRFGFRPMNRINRLRSALNIWRHGFVANPQGWGRATLEINFEHQVALA